MLSLKTEISRFLEEEQLLITKKTGATDLEIVLAYPDIYENGLPNLGHQRLYDILSQISNIGTSRVYLPAHPEDYEEQKIPLFSWEQNRPVKESDILAFTISYEGLFHNVLNILRLSEIPFLIRDRDSSYPLVIAGGPCPTYNPEPLALFIDAFAIGEGEETIIDIIEACGSKKIMKRQGRKSLLKRLAKIPGVYVPSLIEVSYNKHQYLKNIKVLNRASSITNRRQFDGFPDNPSKSFILTPNTIYKEKTLSLELTRGCICQCNFCYLGNGCGKYRAVPVSEITKIAQKAIKLNCALKLFFEGTPKSYFNEIMNSLKKLSKVNQLKLRIGSLRADVVNKDVVELLDFCGQDSLTVAPETGKTLRISLGKNAITDDMIFHGAELAAKQRLKKYCLYFMLGFPNERETDIIEIAELIAASRRVLDSEGSTTTVLEAHINPFFPKPQTPFFGVAMDSVSKCFTKLEILLKIINQIKSKGAKVTLHQLKQTIIGGQEPLFNQYPESSIVIKTIIGGDIHYIQPLLARGSREMGQVLNQVCSIGLNREAWYKVMQKKGILPNRYFESWQDEKSVPWAVISHKEAQK